MFNVDIDLIRPLYTNLIIHYILLFLLVFFSISDNPKKQFPVTRAGSYNQLLHLLKLSVKEKNYLQLWNLLSPPLQEKLNTFILQIKKLKLSDKELMAKDLLSGLKDDSHLQKFGNVIKQNKLDYLTLLNIYLSGKNNIFQRLSDCKDYYLIPQIESLPGDLVKDIKVNEIKKIILNNKNLNSTIKNVYYICQGIKPVKFLKLNTNDWRYHMNDW